MASAAKRRPNESKGKRKRKPSGSDDDSPAFLSSKYAEPPTSKIYNSRFRNNKPAELFRKDLISAMKLPDSEPLCPGEYWSISDSWKPEWERGVQVPVNPEALPEPNMRILRKRNKEGCFKLPKKFIRCTRDSSFSNDLHVFTNVAAQADRACRYDLDDTDVQWLSMVNEEREDFGLLPIEEFTVEVILDELETQCFENFQEAIKSEEGLGIEYDEDAICDVCRSPDSEEGNEMVFCDSCNVCVHQACYGITKIPDGSWICRTCALGIRPSCVLCPNRGGAMKSTRSGQKWAHVSCALWIPEVTIGCVEKMEPIIKISQIPVSRWALVCSLCKDKVGACIQCSVKCCKTAYHVTCAFQHGLQMKAILDEGYDDDGIKLKSYCPRHSKKKTFVSSESEPESTATEECDVASKKELEMSSEERANIRQQKIQERESQFYNYVSTGEVAEIVQVDINVVELIFNFWKLKRKSNFNRPLLPPRAENLDASFLEEDSIYARMKMFVHLRQDLERLINILVTFQKYQEEIRRVRNLCYMVTRREKLAKTWIKVRKEIFLKQAAIVEDDSAKLTKEELDAVLMANYGDPAYDKKYTGISGPAPSVVNVLTTLMGQEYVKTHLNGMFKINKKNEKVQAQKMPNPYAKHYLNGLLKRSQRWLASMARQARENSLHSLSDASGSFIQDEKKDRSASCLNSSGNSMCHEELDISRDSERSDNMHSLDIHQCLLESLSQDKCRISERKSKGYLGSSSMKSLVSSQIKKEFDSNLSSKQGTATVTSMQQNDKNKKKNLSDLKGQNSQSVELKNEDDKNCTTFPPTKISEAIESEGKKKVNEFKNEIQESDGTLYMATEYERSTATNISKCKSNSISRGRPKNSEKNYELYAAGKKSNSDEDTPEQKKYIDDNKNCDCDLNSDQTVNKKLPKYKGNWVQRHKMKYLNKESRINNCDVKNEAGSSVKANTESINKDNCCLELMNNDAKDITVKKEKLATKQIGRVVSRDFDMSVKVDDSEMDKHKIKTEVIIDEANFEGNLSSDEAVSSKQRLSKVDTVKCKAEGKQIVTKNSRIEIKVKKEESSRSESDEINKNDESESIKQSQSIERIECFYKDKQNVQVPDSKCNKQDKGKVLSIDVKLGEEKFSSSCTPSPSSVKSVENETENCDKQRLKSGSSVRTGTSEKHSTDSKVAAAAQKHKSLYSSTHRSSTSVNRHRTSSPSMKPLEKVPSLSRQQSRDLSPEVDKLREESAKIRESLFPDASLPRKGALSGYKIPKKVKTDMFEENSLERKRGNSPLSPLAEFSSSPSSGSSYPSNSYQTRPSKPWSNSGQRTHYKPPVVNGDMESQSQRLVIRLRKDRSDPEAQRWKSDSCVKEKTELYSSWVGDMQSMSCSGPQRYHSPDTQQWTRVRNAGSEERRPLHIPYGPGPPLT